MVKARVQRSMFVDIVVLFWCYQKILRSIVCSSPGIIVHTMRVADSFVATKQETIVATIGER